MSPPHFPISPVELRGDWSFTNLEEGTHLIEGHTVLAREIPHKGGRTFGYRVSDGKVTVAYLSDHSPHTIGPGPDGVGEYHPAAVELVSGSTCSFTTRSTPRPSWPTAATSATPPSSTPSGWRRRPASGG